jgi:hypothetical protein
VRLVLRRTACLVWLAALNCCTFDTSGGVGPDGIAPDSGHDGPAPEIQPPRPDIDVGIDDSAGPKDRYPEAPRDLQLDAAPDTVPDISPDIAPDSKPVTGPFSTPAPLTKLNAPDSDDDPTLTADMLEIFFDSKRPGGKGGGDIWTSTRGSLTGAWSTPINVGVLNTADGETTPEVSPDGLTIHFSSSRTGGLGSGDIYVATRASRTAPWSAPKHVKELCSADGDYAPTVSHDLKYMIMSSTRPGIGDFDLYTVTRAKVTDTWSAPALRNDLDTTYVETDPWYNKARTVIYFATDRPGGKGSWDIWRATRPTASGSFGAPAPVPELNSPQNDSDIWLSPDMSVAYLSSTRDGDCDLFIATR